jgi:hypothetical protein
MLRRGLAPSPVSGRFPSPARAPHLSEPIDDLPVPVQRSQSRGQGHRLSPNAEPASGGRLAPFTSVPLYMDMLGIPGVLPGGRDEFTSTVVVPAGRSSPLPRDLSDSAAAPLRHASAGARGSPASADDRDAGPALLPIARPFRLSGRGSSTGPVAGTSPTERAARGDTPSPSVLSDLKRGGVPRHLKDTRLRDLTPAELRRLARYTVLSCDLKRACFPQIRSGPIRDARARPCAAQ